MYGCYSRAQLEAALTARDGEVDGLTQAAGSMRAQLTSALSTLEEAQRRCAEQEEELATLRASTRAAAAWRRDVGQELAGLKEAEARRVKSQPPPAIAPSTLPYLGLCVREGADAAGLLVEDCIAPAHAAGLRTGDVLCAVLVQKQYATRGLLEYERCLCELPPHAAVTLTARRGSHTQEVTIGPFTPHIATLDTN